MIQLQPYPTYKDSGVPWLGEIPAHWEVRKTKFLFSERVEKGFPDEPLLAATQTKGVVPKSHYGTRTVTAQKDLHLLKLVEVGDFVISLRSFQGGIEYAYYRGIISPAYTVMIPSGTIVPGYFRQLAKSRLFISLLQMCVTGIREGQNVDYNKLRNSLLPLPSQEEQTAIARFLDWETARINKFIRNKRRLIALLKEQKQNVINQAVTRGINPDVKLKPSGVEWLGDIPEHWEAVLNQRIFKENVRPYKGTNEIQLSLSQRDGLIPTKDMQERSLQTSTYDNWKITLPGDLVLNRFKAHLGVFFCTQIRGIVTFHYGVFQPRIKLETLYFEYLFHSEAYKTVFAGRSNGMTVGLQNLSNQNFYNVKSLLPPIKEQLEIVDYIKRESSLIDLTISRTEREIELIREYRTRLISDVVTGKVDVRNIEVETVAEEELIEEVEDREEQMSEEEDLVEEVV